MKVTTAFSKGIAIGLMLIAALSGVANAQKATTRQPMKPQVVSATRSDSATTKREQAQLERVHSYLASLEPKMMAGLKKSKAFDAMEKALQAIAATKDYDTRVKMAKDYQRRYRDAYGQAMRNVGLDFRAIASEIRQLAPDFNVEIVQDFGFKLTPRGLQGVKRAQNGGTFPASAVTTVTRVTDFETRTDPGGAGLGFAIVVARDDLVDARVVSLLAGGGSAWADARKRISIPSRLNQAAIRVRGNIRSDAFAVGVGGVTIVSTKAGIAVGPNPASIFDSPIPLADTTAVAAFLWFSYDVEEYSIPGREIPVDPGNDYEVKLWAYAFGATGISVESHGGGRVDEIVVELIGTE